MNLFEKVFSYQILSQLEDSDVFMVTKMERSWLKMMINQPEVNEAFTSDTIQKLHDILGQEQALNISEVIVEKARSKKESLYHPFIRPLRQKIMAKSCLKLECRTKNNRTFKNEDCYPYKLEFSIVKQTWYLVWYHMRHKAMMSTKLENIESFSEFNVPIEQINQVESTIEGMLEQRKQQAIIEVRKEYNRELTRVLYAFSCFEKVVDYDETSDTYTIRLIFANNEGEYVLSKLRFLGKRVCVIEGPHLRRRMHESATRALGRYGVGME